MVGLFPVVSVSWRAKLFIRVCGTTGVLATFRQYREICYDLKDTKTIQFNRVVCRKKFKQSSTEVMSVGFQGMCGIYFGIRAMLVKVFRIY